MTDASKNHPTRIRTFAGDLAAERSKRDNKTPASNTPHAKTVTQQNHHTLQQTIDHSLVKETKQKEERRGPVVQEPHIEVKKESEKPVTKIPAFHELQKSVTSIQKSNHKELHHKHPVSKTLHKKKSTNKKTPLRTNIGFDATVISDKKSHGFRLLPAIVESFKTWFKKFSAKRKKKAEPKYTVPETERRKGVIQKATSKTGTSFTADNETLKEQIRKRRLQEAQIEKNDDPETTWSPFTEPGYKLLEEPEGQSSQVQNIVVEYKKLRRPAPEIIEPTPLPTQQDKVVEEESNLEDLRWSTNQNEPTIFEPAPDLESPTEENPESTETEPLPEPVNVQKPVSSQEGQLPRRLDRANSNQLFIRFDTNTLTVVLLITIIGFVVILFASRTLFKQFENEESLAILTNNQLQPILSSAELIAITLTTENLNDLPKLVTDTIDSTPAGLVELPVISPVGDEVTASYISRLLNYDILPAFRQSLTSIRFASINHSDPAIILQFVDRDTVLGSLLEWEKEMPADLRTLYAIPPEANGSFSDESIQGVDVRVLRYEGKAVLAYGIIGESTALIAANTTDFALIVELGMPH